MKLIKQIKTMFSGFNPRRYLEMADVELETTREGIAYRLAVRQDIVGLLAIERDVYDGEVPWTFSHFEHEIVQSADSFFLVAEAEEGRLVGFIGIRLGRGTQLYQAHITNLAVMKAYQKRGIASFMIQQIVQLTSQLGKHELSLEARRENGLAQALYRKQGFETKKIMPKYYENGGDAILMSRQLRQDFDDENQAI